MLRKVLDCKGLGVFKKMLANYKRKKDLRQVKKQEKLWDMRLRGLR